MRDQFQTECYEKGQVIDRVIALFFDMVSSYEMAFDKIISNEVLNKKAKLEKEYEKHKQMIMEKDKEFIQMSKDAEKTRDTFENMQNKINSQQA
jgi:hypothetical protein